MAGKRAISLHWTKWKVRMKGMHLSLFTESPDFELTSWREGVSEGGKVQAELTSSWKRKLHLTFAVSFGLYACRHFQWTLDYVPGSHGDNTPTTEQASWTDKHNSIPRFPISRKNAIIPYAVNHLCNLYGTHWYRLQHITSWCFWLWVMAVT